MPVHEISVLYHICENAFLNAHAGVSSEVGGLNGGLSFYLHPHFVYASSEDSGESANMRRLARIFAARRCDKYPYIVQ